MLVVKQLHNVYSEHAGLRRNNGTMPHQSCIFWLREQLATSRLPSQDVIDVMKLSFEHLADCVL